MKRPRIHLNEKGQIASWPAGSKDQFLALEFLADKFKLETPYSERQVNDVLNRFHTFADPALLRRELFTKRFIQRETDGSKYWRPKRSIPQAWSTERLIIADSRAEEVPTLQVIYNDCRYTDPWTGHRSHESPMLAEFNHQTIPSDLDPAHHRLQTIKTKSGAQLIGYLGLYQGFPDETSLWIGTIAITPLFQKQLYGKELIEGLTDTVTSLRSIKRIGCAVSLKNWPAIRFWVANGFHRLDKFTGHDTHTDDTFAEIWLMKSLRPMEFH